MWRLGRLFALLRKEGKLIWAMLRDPRAPLASKLVALLAVAYVISPIDFIPDAIPILGWLDDGLIGYFLLQMAFKFLPEDLLESLRERTGSSQKAKA